MTDTPIIRAARALVLKESGEDGYDALSEELQAQVVESVKAVLRSQWQPIETAPRDGSWILLAGGKTDEHDYRGEVGDESLRRPVVGRWGCEDYNLDTDTNDTLWEMSYWDGDWLTRYVNPTHWMPLPALSE